MPKPLKPGDEPFVEDAHLPVENQRRGRQRGDRGHERGKALGVVTPRPADELYLPLALVGHYPPVVVFLRVDPAGSVEGPVDQSRLHQGDRGGTGRGHGSQYIGGR